MLTARAKEANNYASKSHYTKERVTHQRDRDMRYLRFRQAGRAPHYYITLLLCNFY